MQMISPYVVPGLSFKPMPKHHPTKRGTFKMVRAVCAEYNISPMQIHSASRHRPHVIGRQVLQTILRMLTPMTLEQIGMVVGRRDHATVGYAINQVKGLYQVDTTYRNKVNNILHKIDATHLEAKFMET